MLLIRFGRSMQTAPRPRARMRHDPGAERARLWQTSNAAKTGELNCHVDNAAGADDIFDSEELLERARCSPVRGKSISPSSGNAWQSRTQSIAGYPENLQTKELIATAGRRSGTSTGS